MKSLIRDTVLTLLCIATLVSAQGTLEPEWVIRKSSPLANGNAEAWGIDVDANGHVYWATNQERPGFFQGMDIVFYKLDADGQEIWPAPTTYAGQHAQQVYKVTATDSIIYIGGRNCTQFTLDPDLPFCDMLIIAVEATTGDTLWATTWDRGFGYEEVDGLVVKDHGIYVSGWSAGDATDMDVGLLELDFDGRIVWTNSWGTAGRDHQDGHSVVDDSVIYAAGLTAGVVNPGLCLIKDYNGQAVLAKFSRENGALLDHVAFGRDDPWCNFENAMGMASDGEFLYLTGVTTVAADDWQIFLDKFDRNLNLLWAMTWGGSNLESARAIAIGENGSIYVGGNTTSFGAGDLDVVVLKFSADDNLIWHRTWGAEKEDHVLDIALDGEFLYVTGKTSSFHPEGKFDAFLLKTKADIGTAVEHRTANKLSHLLHPAYPNPFNPSTTIGFHLPGPARVTIAIYNARGQEVRTLVQSYAEAGEYQVEWDGRDESGGKLASGMYYLRMSLPADKRGATITQVRKVVLVR